MTESISIREPCSDENNALSGNGWLAYLGTAFSLIACYFNAIAIVALPALGVGWKFNPHIQALFMWSLALLAVIAIYRDRNKHTDKRPFYIAGTGLLIIIITLYTYYDVLILFFGYLLLLLGTFMNQNAILKLFNLQSQQQALELTEWNRTLEARVSEQVAELDRVGQLKRFLSPEVANLVIAQGDNSLLESHRSYVATLFCDLRGFTAFSESAEPEEVMDVLQVYHLVVGQLVAEYGGTINHRAGDGLMIIFNDPLPCDEPVRRAIELAFATRDAVRELTQSWAKLGYKLGFGIGITAGYATLGIVGDESRSDYTAIGNAINLASRLSDHAKDGQILISQRAYREVEKLVEGHELAGLNLDGVSRSHKVYSVTSLH